MKKENTRRGFTLLELLVVVLIIGILTAVAVPQYQKAVLKSRFSSLMPPAQAVRDGQETHYLMHGSYADEVADLDITVRNTGNTLLSVADTDPYTYTLATRPNSKNNLIMYQKHSKNYPGEIHCEAKATDTQANWLCEEGMHAVKSLGEGITSGYNLYVLEGNGNGKTPFQHKVDKSAQWFKDLIAAEQAYYQEHGEYLKDVRNLDIDLEGVTSWSGQFAGWVFSMPANLGGGNLDMLYASVPQIGWNVLGTGAYSVVIRLDKLRNGQEGVTCTSSTSSGTKFCTEFLSNWN